MSVEVDHLKQTTDVNIGGVGRGGACGVGAGGIWERLVPLNLAANLNALKSLLNHKGENCLWFHGGPRSTLVQER